MRAFGLMIRVGSVEGKVTYVSKRADAVTEVSGMRRYALVSFI
jgi:hypothetical protein